jgi:hypothetical protein
MNSGVGWLMVLVMTLPFGRTLKTVLWTLSENAAFILPPLTKPSRKGMVDVVYPAGGLKLLIIGLIIITPPVMAWIPLCIKN